MLQGLNFSHLECFFSLANTLSFSKTSKELKISQSAVSKRIQNLEKELNFQLLIRTKHDVNLSTKGKLFYEQMGPLYNEMGQRLERFSEKKNVLQGKITFACFQEIGEKLFIKILSQFKKKHPLVQIDMKFLKTSEIIQGVKEGNIDIGIISDPIVLESIRSYLVMKEEIVLVTSKKNSKTKTANLAKLPFVTYREDHQLLGKFLKKHFPRQMSDKLAIEFSVSSHRAMIEVIKEHDYYAVLPYLSIKDEVQKGELHILETKSIKNDLHLIHLDLEFIEPKVEALRKQILESIPN